LGAEFNHLCICGHHRIELRPEGLYLGLQIGVFGCRREAVSTSHKYFGTNKQKN